MTACLAPVRPVRLAAVMAALFAAAIAHSVLAGAPAGEPVPEAPSCVGCHTSEPAPQAE